MVRCKFRLASITNFAGTTMQKFTFHAVHDDSIPENAAFTRYTPSGQFEMNVDNPAAQEKFKVGDYYYFDINPVPAV